MRISTVIILGVAALCAAFAALLANVWLRNQTPQAIVQKTTVTKDIKMSSVVVAGKSLRFGTELNSSNIKVVPWPAKSIPKGSFRTTGDLLKAGKRQVLIALAPNEPILKGKVTKPNEKASLSTVISEDKRAVTIRVNDVLGVGGLIHPQDFVDIALTRGTNRSGDAGTAGKAFTDVLLQNVKVLAIDQSSDRVKKSKPAKTVTLEVNTLQAQKLALASSVGQLSLMLRSAGATNKDVTRRISIDDLIGNKSGGETGLNDSSPSVVVTRSVDRKEYKVPTDVHRFQSGSNN